MVAKVKKGVALGGCLTLRNNKGKEIELTQDQYDVLILITEEFLTHKQVGLRRKTSRQAVTKIVRKLKDKGMLGIKNINSRVVAKKGVTMQPSRQKIRLHGVRWTIKILKKFDSFKGKETFKLNRDTIKVWEDSIEIYSNQDFNGATPDESFNKCLIYYERVFLKLENRLRVSLIKNEYINIELTKCEFANVNDILATECIKEKDTKKLQLYDDKGKWWATIDNSLDLFEFETINAQTAKGDLERYLKVINEYKNNADLMTPKQIQMLLQQMLEMQNVTNIQILGLTKKMEKIEK